MNYRRELQQLKALAIIFVGLYMIAQAVILAMGA